MEEYVIRFRCNLSDQSHDVPISLTAYEMRLLTEVSEKVRMSSEWDFQMEVLPNTMHASEEVVENAQKALLEGVNRGMIAPREVEENFPDGFFSEE